MVGYKSNARSRLLTLYFAHNGHQIPLSDILNMYLLELLQILINFTSIQHFSRGYGNLLLVSYYEMVLSSFG